MILIGLALGISGVAAIMGVGRLRYSARHAWKERAIQEIAQRTGDPRWSVEQSELLRKAGAPDRDNPDTWLSGQMILMQNGDWVAYTNICRKENWRIDDLFIGKGSDRQWYYSTYHFCIGMVVLRMETQPASLDEFVKAYYLRSFDGHSDECLQKTWPRIPGE